VLGAVDSPDFRLWRLWLLFYSLLYRGFDSALRLSGNPKLVRRTILASGMEIALIIDHHAHNGTTFALP